MKIWLRNVTRAWVDVVEKLSSPDEVNLWQVGAHSAWHRPAPGDLVLFRPKDRKRDIAGYGRFITTACHSPQEVWDLFAFANGAWSLDGLLAQIDSRRGTTKTGPPVLANAIMAQPVFFPPLNPFELPDAFPTNATAKPLCSAWSRRGRILIVSLRHHAGRSLIFGDSPQARLLGYRTYRVPGTVVQVDRAALRCIVSELSGHRCAISGEKLTVTLDAAHAWPRQYGGSDDLGNMMLLAMQFNRLWDTGLIGVDAGHRIMVSEQLRLLEPNSHHLRYAGQPLRRRRSGPPYPDAANLRWHRNHLFRWPKYNP